MMFTNIRDWFISFVSNVWFTWIGSWESFSQLAMWVWIQIIIILLIIFFFKLFRTKKFWIIFDLLVEKVYEFFEEILEKAWKKRIKQYVTTLFFVILISNLLWWCIDFVRLMFNDVEFLDKVVSIPTSNLEFNIWMAVISILLFLFSQFKHLWLFKFLHEYFPIKWKWIITLDWNIKNKFVKIIFFPIIKLFDIIISLFIWLLDLVWVLAKVISLSARLYWNILAWGVLLGIMVTGVNWLARAIVWENFPVFFPLILFIQSLLVSVIQALVFSLLVWIFIKIWSSD